MFKERFAGYFQKRLRERARKFSHARAATGYQDNCLHALYCTPTPTLASMRFRYLSCHKQSAFKTYQRTRTRIGGALENNANVGVWACQMRRVPPHFDIPQLHDKIGHLVETVSTELQICCGRTDIKAEQGASIFRTVSEKQKTSCDARFLNERVLSCEPPPPFRRARKRAQAQPPIPGRGSSQIRLRH